MAIDDNKYSDLKTAFDEVRRRNTAEETRRQDFDDQQRELSGLETGRINRFVPASARDARDGKGGKHGDKDGQPLSRLQLLLATDPAYAALYNDTMDKLRAAENAADAALQRLIERRGQLRDEIADMRERAAKLPDGTAVFRAENGSVWTEHGEEITEPERLDSIVWPDDDPAYEAWTGKHDELAGVNTGVGDVRDYQVNTLGPAREQMTDNDNPLAPETIQRINRDIETQGPDYLTSPLQHETPAPASEATAGIKIPDLP